MKNHSEIAADFARFTEVWGYAGIGVSNGPCGAFWRFTPPPTANPVCAMAWLMQLDADVQDTMAQYLGRIDTDAHYAFLEEVKRFINLMNGNHKTK